MSVAFANAVVEGLRHNGVPVRFIDGWDRRGNGQVSSYLGLSWHHTASDYGRAYSTLWNGRAGLSGPLCNSSGDNDGGITIVAAHPANHAGASGGRSMGPLPTTNLFNKLMWGHEIVYPGTSPMTDAQYRSAQILAGVVSGILRRPNADWCRGHAETSITGKWDPGYEDGRTYDLNAMRAGVWGALHGPVTPPAPPTSIHTEEDAMYIKCRMVDGKPESEVTGILSGPLFIGLGSPGERQSANEAIAKGATVQWVQKFTWDALAARNPRPDDITKLGKQLAEISEMLENVLPHDDDQAV